MNTTEMDTEFARGVRAELTAIGTRDSILQGRQRRSRVLAIGVGTLMLAGATAGTAIAVSNLPGTTAVVLLGDPVTVTNTGTAIIDLGAIPANATAVVVDLTCLSDKAQVALRTIQTADGVGEAMSGAFCSTGYTTRFENVMLPRNGTTAITVAAKPGTKWTATAQYATLSASEWGTNAQGQTYGVPNVNGVPDLTAMQASNGEWGYVKTRERDQLGSQAFITVCKSDGSTIIGRMETGIVVGNPKGPFETFTFDDFSEELDGE